MRKSAFTESQIVEAVKRAEAGTKVTDLAWELGVSGGTARRHAGAPTAYCRST